MNKNEISVQTFKERFAGQEELSLTQLEQQNISYGKIITFDSYIIDHVLGDCEQIGFVFIDLSDDMVVYALYRSREEERGAYFLVGKEPLEFDDLIEDFIVHETTYPQQGVDLEEDVYPNSKETLLYILQAQFPESNYLKPV